VSSQISRRAHSIKKERIIYRRIRIVKVISRVNFHIFGSAPVERGEKRAKPIGMFVINRNLMIIHIKKNKRPLYQQAVFCRNTFLTKVLFLHAKPLAD
jgi:hypothetical protein